MNVNQSLVEQEKIRFETRLSDWKEGGLSDEFFIKKLESHERALDLRFHDKIDSENTSNKKKRTDTERPDKALLNKGSSTVIESGPVMYKKDDKEFNPLSFVHPERRQFIPSCEEADTNNIPPKRINATTKGADKIEVTASQHRSQADKLIDKWANLRKEEVRMERERNTLEGLEKEREKEIQEWLLTQKKTGETYSNPNFIPLGKGHI